MTMKKAYQQPVVEVEELVTESPLLVNSDDPKRLFNEVQATEIGVGYGGQGNGAVRSGGSTLWDDDSNWDNI